MSIQAGPSHHWTVEEIPYGSIDRQRTRADPCLLYLVAGCGGLFRRDYLRPLCQQFRGVFRRRGCCSVPCGRAPCSSVLHALGLPALAPYPMVATVPFSVPRVLSLAFWGGVWGIPLALGLMCLRARAGYWWTALLFGAIGPSMVNWLVVLPLKGASIGGGRQPSAIVTALVINGAWGLGTALLLRWAASRAGRTERPAGP